MNRYNDARGTVMIGIRCAARCSALLALSLIVASGEADAAPSTQFTVFGDVAQPGTFDLSALQALPATTETATYLAGGSPVTDTYTGVSLWSLLNGAGIVTDPAIKNDILNKYVIATGSDGYKAVFSLGELNPKFGNKADIVAYADTGGQLQGAGGDGFARLVIPADIAGGRYVSNLVTLQVVSGPTHHAGPGGPSTSFVLAGNLTHIGTVDLAQLQALPALTRTVTFLSAGKPVTDTYTGVSLWTLLNAAGILTDPGVKNDILRDYVVATGSDGYQAILSLGELNPKFGNEPDLVAYADTAGTLPGGDGFARLVVPNDIAGGRYVSNLVSLEVFHIVAEPASLPLLLAGGAIFLALRRRDAR
jgi:hypothetical protein